MMSEPKRLHPIMCIFLVGKGLRRGLLPLIYLLIPLNHTDVWHVVAEITILAIMISILIIPILTWFKFTYQLENEELWINSGVLFRKKRIIPLERIQSINFIRGPLLRIFGLVKVQIETAAGGVDEAEAVLSAVKKPEAQFIRDYVAASKRDGVDSEQGLPIFKLSLKELVAYAFISGGMGIILSVVLGVLSQWDDLFRMKPLLRIVGIWAGQHYFLLATFIFIGVVIFWILGIIITMLKYANFKVTKAGNHFIISSGLIKKREMNIPFKRIQSIRLSERIIGQILGYGTVYLESAGGSLTELESSRVTLFPLVKVSQVPSLLEEHLPEYSLQSTVHPLPKRAVWRYILRMWYFAVPIVVCSIIFLKLWGFLSFGLLLLVTFWGISKYKAAGWRVEEQQLTLRYRMIDRSTVFIRKNRIQSLNGRESYFQRKRDLGTIEASVKAGAGGGGASVLDLEKQDLKLIFDWFSRTKKKGDSDE